MSDAVKYTNKLQNARVLVIGGSSGLGFTAAEATLESGASAVIISSSNPSRVDTAIQRLSKTYPSRASALSGYACNLGDESHLEANIKSLFDSATENGAKKLDHVLFTAGDQLAIKPLTDATFDFIKQAGMVRFFAPLLVGKYAKQHLKEGRESSYVITSGGVGHRPIPDWTILGSYASGQQGMVRGLALDLAPRRCILISPGAVETELWDTTDEERRSNLFKFTEKTSVTKKLAQPENVAEAYLYAMKDYNNTGTIVTTDSGFLLLGPGH
ncbi:MAG: hypothetical protein M1820_009817 [Bogoriella megaspora]|nr:MAG: hypothetical protein M1820_009817 [Bogoriella megaspora]